MKRAVCLLVLAALAVVPAHARLGEKVETLKARYGKPQPQVKKNAAVWFFEGDNDQQLTYAVTFDEKGQSIAEGLRPVKFAALTETHVKPFIEDELAPYRDSKTLRTMKPGEKYVFGGREYVCGPEEFVMVDDPNDLLIVWNRSRQPSVIAIRHAMMQ